jgi:hypothetical protein
LESAAGWTLAVVTVVVGYYQINQLDKSGRLNWLSKKRPEWLWMAIGSALLLAPLVIASVVLIRFGIEVRLLDLPKQCTMDAVVGPRLNNLVMANAMTR